jgi:nicotinate-nucleotide adenylyltransferase
MASLEERIAGAMRVAHDPRIRVLDLESRLGTRYTIDTIVALQTRFPRTQFVWLMGADNLAQMRYWQDWPAIFARLPIAVFDRPTYCRRALAGLAAQRFAAARVMHPSRSFAATKPPAWVFLPVKLDPHSATEIRSQTGAHSRR